MLSRNLTSLTLNALSSTLMLHPAFCLFGLALINLSRTTSTQIRPINPNATPAEMHACKPAAAENWKKKEKTMWGHGAQQCADRLCGVGRQRKDWRGISAKRIRNQLLDRSTRGGPAPIARESTGASSSSSSERNPLLTVSFCSCSLSVFVLFLRRFLSSSVVFP